MLSLQFGAVPAWHPLVTLQISDPLHHRPSLQAASFCVCTHWLVVSLQVSAVQEIPSLQFGAVPAWQPLDTLQVSDPLHH